MGSQCPAYNHGRHDVNDARTNEHHCQEQKSTSNRYHSKFIYYHSDSHSNYDSNMNVQPNNHHYPTNKRDHESDYQHPESNYQHSKTGYQRPGSNYQHSQTDHQHLESDYQHSKTDYQHPESNSYHSKDYQHPRWDSQHSKTDYQHKESDDLHSESDNDDSVINNDDESSTEEEEEVSDSEGTGEDLEKQDDEEAAYPEIMAYSRHRRRNHRTVHERSQRIKYSRVTLPSGRHATISIPKVSGWKCGMKTKLITLKPTGHLGRAEYKIVASEMRHTLRNKQNFFCLLLPFSPLCSSGVDIVKIQKIVNGCIWDKYRAYQKQVHDENHYINERMLFHGTPKAKVLLKNGFDERMSSMHGLFGAGIYFAQHAGKSDNYVFGLNGGCKKHNDRDCTICIRHMLLCRVTLGKVERLSVPKSFPHAPPGKHSVQGVPGIALDYPEHIVYRGEQAYPEYLISYKKK